MFGYTDPTPLFGDGIDCGLDVCPYVQRDDAGIYDSQICRSVHFQRTIHDPFAWELG